MAAAEVLLGNGQAPGGQREDVRVAGDDVLGVGEFPGQQGGRAGEPSRAGGGPEGGHPEEHPSIQLQAIAEPIHVAMTPLAVWAENAEQTTRNAGLAASYLRRELDLKRQIQALQRIVWNQSPAASRSAFLTDAIFVPPPAARAKSLSKALIPHPPTDLALRVAVEMALRGVAILALGRLSPEFLPFIESRRGA